MFKFEKNWLHKEKWVSSLKGFSRSLTCYVHFETLRQRFILQTYFTTLHFISPHMLVVSPRKKYHGKQFGNHLNI